MKGASDKDNKKEKGAKTQAITVVIRARPLIPSEKGAESIITSLSEVLF